jgi:aryl-alcohol dehydrogenase-like predicted oxidoreductase
VGRWLAQGGGRRDKIALATKVFSRTGPGPNDRGLSAYHIRAACEASLRRLQTDHIDIYQMHHVDEATSFDEIWQAMGVLTGQGKIVYVGSSNFGARHLAAAQHSAREHRLLGLVSEQSLYNLSNRCIELELIPTCRELGIGLICWSPLAGGMLAGGMAGASGGRRNSQRTRDRFVEHREQVVEYEALCRELGESPATVALSWLVQRPGVTCPIIGPRTVEQLESAMRALELPLDVETLARLDEIWPGMGGESPEAYTW